MSRVVTIDTKVRDGASLRAACLRQGLAEPVLGTHPLSGAVASGFAVQLPGWKYPAVFQLDAGLVKFYNSDSGLGEEVELDSLLEACNPSATGSNPAPTFCIDGSEIRLARSNTAV